MKKIFLMCVYLVSGSLFGHLPKFDLDCKNSKYHLYFFEHMYFNKWLKSHENKDGVVDQFVSQQMSRFHIESNKDLELEKSKIMKDLAKETSDVEYKRTLEAVLRCIKKMQKHHDLTN